MVINKNCSISGYNHGEWVVIKKKRLVARNTVNCSIFLTDSWWLMPLCKMVSKGCNEGWGRYKLFIVAVNCNQQTRKSNGSHLSQIIHMEANALLLWPSLVLTVEMVRGDLPCMDVFLVQHYFPLKWYLTMVNNLSVANQRSIIISYNTQLLLVIVCCHAT